MRDGIDEDTFVAMRTKRDATLEVPLSILPSIQVNVRGGAFPPAEENGIAYLKIPLNALPQRAKPTAALPQPRLEHWWCMLGCKERRPPGTRLRTS